MSSQTDVKSVHSSAATANQSLVAVRCRIKSVIVAGGAGSGTARFLDASGGTVLLEIDTGTNSNLTNVLLPGQGILFPNGVWYTPTAVAPLGVTVVYA